MKETDEGSNINSLGKKTTLPVSLKIINYFIMDEICNINQTGHLAVIEINGVLPKTV